MGNLFGGLAMEKTNKEKENKTRKQKEKHSNMVCEDAKSIGSAAYSPQPHAQQKHKHKKKNIAAQHA